MNRRTDRIVSALTCISLAFFALAVVSACLGRVEHATFEAVAGGYMLLLAEFAMIYAKKG